MVSAIEDITIFSENAQKLADFYKNSLGLKVEIEAEMGESGEKVFGFKMQGGSGFAIVDHSKVRGKNTLPERMMVNFRVDDITAEVKRLDKLGTRKIRDTYHLQEYGLIATYEDPDGNYFQLVQTKAK